MGAIRAHLVDLNVRPVQCLRQAPGLERLGPAFEFRNPALELHPEPQILIVVESRAEHPGRRRRLQQRHRIFLDGSRPRIEPADDLLAEARVPCKPLRIDDDVVRLPGALGQVVLGINHFGRFTARPRQRLQRVAPFRSGAQVEPREVVGLAAPGRLLLLWRLRAGADPRRRELLNFQRKRELWICRHPPDDREHLVGAVPGPGDPFKRVAVRTRAKDGLFLVAAGRARNPLRVRQLRSKVACPAQPQVRRGGRVRRDLHAVRALELEAGGSYAQRIAARLQPPRRKPVFAASIGHDRRRDGRARSSGADQHAFHRAFFGGDHTAGQRRRRPGISPQPA